MKKQMFQFLAVFLTLLLLAGCAGSPAAPSEDSTVPPATEPTELVFNGKSYPLDVESLEIGTYDLEQLRWATNLRELVISGSAPESWEFLSTLSALETLTIHLSGTEAADVRLDGALLPALKTLEISADSPIETLALPQAGLKAAALHFRNCGVWISLPPRWKRCCSPCPARRTKPYRGVCRAWNVKIFHRMTRCWDWTGWKV